jgi:hypothetical protein
VVAGGVPLGHTIRHVYRRPNLSYKHLKNVFQCLLTLYLIAERMGKNCNDSYNFYAFQIFSLLNNPLRKLWNSSSPAATSTKLENFVPS